MKKILKPKGLIGINRKKPIGIGDILPYLPNESGFVDTRHWVWGGDIPYIFLEIDDEDDKDMCNKGTE